jgi:hypothetical protein
MKRGRRHPRGSIMVLAIIVSVILSALICVMCWMATEQTQRTASLSKVDQAFFAAEGGLERVKWYCKNGQLGEIKSPLVGTINGLSYSVSWSTVSGSTIKVSSTGSAGNASYSLSAQVTPPTEAPSLAVGGAMADAGPINVTGNLAVAGDVTRAGKTILETAPGKPPSSLMISGYLFSAGHFDIPGDLLVNESITAMGSITVGGDVQAGEVILHAGNWDITGATTPYTNPNVKISVPTVDTAALIRDAKSQGKVLHKGIFTSPTIDFTSSPNGIVCYDGDTTILGNVNFRGSGTLVINGTLTMAGNIGKHNSPAQAHLVTTDDLVMSGNLNLNGSLCVGHVLSKSGPTQVNGVIAVQSTLLGAGPLTVTYATPPSFVHYSGGGGGSEKMEVTAFSGPQP